ncbi:VanW family protein [Rubrobacter aplysinae]|uniref:VanW family protein n=1 Tax=Rubrobacter aplysinae TaxID=909625 RepID=UPI00064C0508|nr:VanW family protein [Rubrobacter aplysinae]
MAGASLLGVVVVLFAALGASPQASEGGIPRGVEAGGLDLGGKSTEEAEKLLRERAYALNEIRVSGDGKEVTVPAESVGVRPDVEATVRNARKVGREGNVIERARERAGGLVGTVEVPLEVAYDGEKVRDVSESLARRLGEDPTQAGVSVSLAGVEVSQSAEGYEVDVDQTAANIRGSIESLEGEAELAGGATRPEISTAEAENTAEKVRTAISEPATLAADGERWELSPRQIAGLINVTPESSRLEVYLSPQALRSELSGMYSSINVEAREADYRFAGDSVEVVPGRTGQSIQTLELLGELRSGLLQGKREYEVPVAEDVPELTTQEARQQRPTQLIGKYRTTFEGTGDDAPARVDNLRTASEALTGQTLAPGEVLSANDVLAPLDYKKTKVFVDGKVEKAAGGGLCQVSSTLYMAANYAGLDIVERNAHFALLNYIRPGLDATVWFGAENGYRGQELDMRFRNTTEGYVMIREYVADDGYIYAEVWGQPTGKKVTMDSKNLVENENISKWRTTKTVKNAQGEVVSSGPIYTSTYYALETDEGKLPPTEVDVAPVRP